MNCYNKCKSMGYPDCSDMRANCQTTGGTLVFQECDGGGDFLGFSALFVCQ